MLIPKKIHIIWVGDDTKMPTACIGSWKRNHPNWDVRVWTNHDLETFDWLNASHIKSFAERERWPGVADLMRYEILYREGGVYVDADSFSVRPLADWLLESDMFAAWEDTLSSARLVNNAFMGSVAHNPFLKFVIDEISSKVDLFSRWSWSRMRTVRMSAWRSVGPYHLTKCIERFNTTGYHDITILPSHMFSPKHFRGNTYNGSGVIFADHQWGSTKKLYTQMVLTDDLSHDMAPDERAPQGNLAKQKKEIMSRPTLSTVVNTPNIMLAKSHSVRVIQKDRGHSTAIAPRP